VLYLVSIDVMFDQIKWLMFYNVQITNLAFVDKIRDIQ
jgi:hypothetical protein